MFLTRIELRRRILIEFHWRRTPLLQFRMNISFFGLLNRLQCVTIYHFIVSLPILQNDSYRFVKNPIHMTWDASTRQTTLKKATLYISSSRDFPRKIWQHLPKSHLMAWELAPGRDEILACGRKNAIIYNWFLPLLKSYKKLGHASLVVFNGTSLNHVHSNTKIHIYIPTFAAPLSRPSELQKHRRCSELHFFSFVVFPLSDPVRWIRTRRRDTPVGNNTSFEALESSTRSIPRTTVRRVFAQQWKFIPSCPTGHRLDQCRVEVNGHQWLDESQLIQVKNRWFKVEDCRLNRAYAVTCGSKLFDRLRFIACSIMDQIVDAPTIGRRWRRNTQIDAARLEPSKENLCCEKACTMADLVQYCPVR